MHGLPNKILDFLWARKCPNPIPLIFIERNASLKVQELGCGLGRTYSFIMGPDIGI